MAQLVAIDNKNHLNLKVDVSKAELHGASLHLVPAVVSEFANMAVQYPLVLTKHEETGQLVCAAMLGFEAGENLFWQGEQWQGLYLPLQIRRQPFFVGNADKERDYVICIDSDSPTISQNVGQPIFTENGEETEYFQQAKSCLAQLLQGELENKQLFELLEQMDLLQVMKMEITFSNKQSTTLNGLYTVDEEKLAALSSEQMTILHKAGFLPAIYALIISLGQMHHLIDLKNKMLGC